MFSNRCTDIYHFHSGKIQVTGDTGLALNVVVKDVALEC